MEYWDVKENRANCRGPRLADGAGGDDVDELTDILERLCIDPEFVHDQ